MANKKIFLLLCLFVVLGFVILAFFYSQKILPQNTPTVTIPVPDAPTLTAITLASGVTMRAPSDWHAKALPPDEQYQSYEITTPVNEFPLIDVRVDEWLKGPNADEGYVINHEKRPQALAVLQSIYTHEEITKDDHVAFHAIAGEFLGYSDQYRSALTYIRSTDNSFRGISFYNLIGQDFGVSPVYYIVLYNPETGSVVYANYYLDQTTPEVAAANAKLMAIDRTKNNDEKMIAKLDLEAREQFKNTVETTSRRILSFGLGIDALDAFMKTISRGK